MALEVHISPTGTGDDVDSNDGHHETLRQARDHIRQDISKTGSKDINVILHDGIYTVNEPFKLTPLDGGDNTYSITYQAKSGESPTICGSRKISDWYKPDYQIPGLPPKSQDKVWVSDLPKLNGEPWEFSVLFDGNGLLTRAHSPLRTHINPPESLPIEQRRTRLFVESIESEWTNMSDAEIFFTPKYPWTVNYLPISSIDKSSDMIELSIPATYPIEKPRGTGESGFYRVENVFEHLSSPGRWVLDTDKEQVYLWPRNQSDGEKPKDIRAPVVNELLFLSGNSDDNRWVKNITFSGITFKHADRMRWDGDRVSLQHDWEQHDMGNSLVRLRGTENILFSHCEFKQSGSSGIRFDRHVVESKIRHCELTNLGGTGILLDGYGPGSRDENHHNEIYGNHIHRIGLHWWHSPGVLISQSGHNHISQNHIHSLPYNGIALTGPRKAVFDPDDLSDTDEFIQKSSKNFEGNKTIRFTEVGNTPLAPPHVLGLRHTRYNQIEHNDIHDVMERLGDGNGIYLSGTGEGNLVRRNYVHDISGKNAHSGIRLDDEQFHTLVMENVVVGIHGAGIVVKHVNQIQNNIIYDCYRNDDADFSHLMVTVRNKGPAFGSGIRRNIIVQSNRDNSLPLIKLTEHLDHCLVDDNLYYSEKDPSISDQIIKKLRNQNQGTRSISADPEFEDTIGGDYRISENSPARKIGFRPFENWGTTIDME